MQDYFSMRDFFHILKDLDIKHSFLYSRDLFLNQSRNRSLWGIKQLLEKYNVKVTAVKVESNSLDNVSCPFVYQGEDGFYTMLHKPENPETFEQAWNGIALLCDTSKAREPHYLLHKANDMATMAAPWIILTAALIFLTAYLTDPFSLERTLLAVFSLAGLYFSWKSAANECSGSCSAVTGSPAGKILGYSLSVIGMAWFGISALAIVLIPQWLPLWNIIAVLALAMPLWSIFWQAAVLKAWCKNCIAVQAAVICCAATVIAGGNLGFDSVTWRSAAAIPSLFIITVHVLHIAFEYYKKAIHPPLDISVLKMMSNPQLRNQIVEMGEKVEADGFPELWTLNPGGKTKVFIALGLRCSHCKNMFSRILEDQRKGRLSQYHITFALNSMGQDKAIAEVLAATSVQKGSPAALELLAQWFDNHNSKTFNRLASNLLPTDGVKEALDTMDNIAEKLNIKELPFVVMDGHEIAPSVFWADVELNN